VMFLARSPPSTHAVTQYVSPSWIIGIIHELVARDHRDAAERTDLHAVGLGRKRLASARQATAVDPLW
jgi:hypothetical protein